MKVWLLIGGLLTLAACSDEDKPNESSTEPSSEEVDSDGDGVIDTEDAFPDDPNESVDSDGDGVGANADCDDEDASLLSTDNDRDCDGILTEEDCDDQNAESTIVADDSDCDGTLAVDDCNDDDPDSTLVAEDTDCDGIITADDCDDNDPNTVNDMDCDGQLSTDDCDDNDPYDIPFNIDTDCDGTVDNIYLSVGGMHNCVINNNQNILCWGKNNDGESNPPTGTFKSVSAGLFHTCAIDTNDSIQCWGRDTDGQSTPPTGTFESVAVSGLHSCAVDTNGTVQCWGSDSDGQVSGAPATGSFTQVATGRYHTCTLDTNGTISCWGDDSHGQVSNVPTGTFTSIDSGRNHSCAVDSNRGVQCWGNDDDGQVSTIPSGQFLDVSVQGTYANGSHSCVIDTNREIQCWGSNDNGKATPPTGQFLLVGTGGHHSCGLTIAGSVECWGINDGSSLDYGQTTPQLTDLFCTNTSDSDCDGTPVSDDCDDNDFHTNPNAVEVCGDGADNNCNGTTNEQNALNCTNYYYDGDGDTFGVAYPPVNIGGSQVECWCEGGNNSYTGLDTTDCYDNNANVHPLQTQYFAYHRGDGSFDYNCNYGQEELQYQSISNGCQWGTFGDFECITNNVGWQGYLPQCGQTGTWIEDCDGSYDIFCYGICTASWYLNGFSSAAQCYLSCTNSCNPQYDTKTQGCR